EHPDDLEAKAFLAWSCWHVKDKGLPIQSHVAVDGLLRDVLAERPSHPGAHHYTIHLWDQEKAGRALVSAAKYGPSSPGIAHAWHMPGHIYSKLHRHADAAWHQEASSRVDHAQMRRDGTMPWQIHNYAHNQQWCAKSLGHVGRVRDGLSLAANLISIPKHPKLNHEGASGQCFREGRARMMDLLSAWELWDELLARADGPLAPIENREDTVQRGRAVGAALIEKGRLAEARALVESLEALRATPEKEEEKKDDEPYKEEEPKKDEKKKDDKKGKALEAAIHELRGRLALAAGETKEAVEHLEKAELPKAVLAGLWLRAGEKEKAEKASKEAVAGGQGELLPLAVRAEVVGKHPPELAQTGRFADADLPILRRIGFTPPSPRPMPEAGTRGTSLDDLGPLLWSPVSAPPVPFTVDRPTLLIFYLGSGCAHCRQQLEVFAKVDVESAGLQVVAISTETAEQVEKAREEKRVVVPFAMRADPERGLFKAFRCWDDFEDMPLHGTFLLDAEGRIRWRDISYTPFMEAEFLVKEATRLLSN
ncbi:MAG TPA: redoxin domain-containing protein, partial [Planctomycetota bacterium]|nr:redoxin domain-containing protein [Planctomycetota bacterium]